MKFRDYMIGLGVGLCLTGAATFCESGKSLEEKANTPVKTESEKKTSVEYHVVEKGDSLWKIHTNYGVSVDDLKKYNPAIGEDNLIKVGQKVYLRPASSGLEKSMPTKISQRGIDLIKTSEGFGDKPYWDLKHWAIGYGHENIEGYKKITKEEASRLLDKDLDSIGKAVSRNVNVPLTQGQYDALVSFTYNFNEKKLKNSELLEKLNKKDYAGAAEQFKRWVHKYNKDGSKEVLQGLVIRREKEYKMFLGK